ncbi:hypothetical protein OF897_03620 [Chryseobacterium formosus]|uniref:Uncharacterized protein n=1 Tax=Chryseobacterium formosus TaxID=1537363 RepID=A0ABT3XLM7_9FLAO|nr:hypothetical protein [Chryseobacterium formosus]MCX8523009.1 hypothetical protein [Chryseobacterium formosus]
MAKHPKFYVQNSAIQILSNSQTFLLSTSNFLFRSREPAFTTRFFGIFCGGKAAAKYPEKSSNMPFNQG